MSFCEFFFSMAGYTQIGKIVTIVYSELFFFLFTYFCPYFAHVFPNIPNFVG